MIGASSGLSALLIPALLFLFLLAMFIIPGMVARSMYFNFPFSDEARARDTMSGIFWTIVTGTCIEVAWLWLHHLITGRWLRSDELAMLLSSQPEGDLDLIIMQNMVEKRLQFMFFLCLPIPISAGLGIAVRHLVLRTRADIHIPLFRYSNRWYYIMSGKMELVGDKLVPLPPDVNYVRAEVLCRQDEKHVIYSGRVIEFRLLPGNRLYSFKLQHPFRQFPEAAKEHLPTQDITDGYEAMDNKELTFLYDDIIDLRTFYYSLQPERSVIT